MLSLGSERLHARIDEALRLSGPAALGWRLYLDGEDYSEDVGGGGYVHEEGPAAVLEVEVASPAIESAGDLAGREVLMEWHVTDERGAIPVYAYIGEISEVESPKGSLTSTIHASTPGADLDSTELGSRIEYGGVNPSTAVADALNRIESYRRGLVRVERVEEPKFVRQGVDAYSRTDMAGNILEGVWAENDAWTHYDTPDGGCIAALEPSLESTPEPVWTFDEDDLKEFDDGRESDRIRTIGVRRAKVDPLPGTDPWEVLKRVDVPGSTAPIGTIEWIDVSDNTSEALEAGFRQAHERASAIAYGKGSISFTCSYVHPRIVRGDPVAVLRSGKDRQGEYVEKFLCILSKADCPEIALKKGHYAGVARVVETVRVESGLEVPVGLSAGISRPTEGYTLSGNLYAPDDAPWLTVNANGDLVGDDSVIIEDANGDLTYA
jgi:hypothetical protein